MQATALTSAANQRKPAEQTNAATKELCNCRNAAAESAQSRQKNGGKSIQVGSAAGAAAVGVPRSARAIDAKREVAARAAYNASLAIEADDTGQTAAARCWSWSDRLIKRRVKFVNTIFLLFKLFNILQLKKNVLVYPAV